MENIYDPLYCRNCKYNQLIVFNPVILLNKLLYLIYFGVELGKLATTLQLVILTERVAKMASHNEVHVDIEEDKATGESTQRESMLWRSGAKNSAESMEFEELESVVWRKVCGFFTRLCCYRY